MGHFIKYSKLSSTTQFIGWMLIFFLTVGGCATYSIREEPEQYNEIMPENLVVVFPLDNRSDNFAECVENIIYGFCPNLQFFSPEKFADSLFPWFEPSTFPESKEDLNALLKNRLVQARLDKLGVRYVISIHGETFQSEYHSLLGDFFTEPLAGGGGIVFVEAYRETDIYASVIDLKEAILPLKTESHRAKKRRYAGVLFVLPLYIQPAMTEIPTCYEIGKKIAQHLSGCESIIDIEIHHSR
jgi:hypothetical protein